MAWRKSGATTACLWVSTKLKLITGFRRHGGSHTLISADEADGETDHCFRLLRGSRSCSQNTVTDLKKCNSMASLQTAQSEKASASRCHLQFTLKHLWYTVKLNQPYAEWPAVWSSGGYRMIIKTVGPAGLVMLIKLVSIKGNVLWKNNSIFQNKSGVSTVC